MSLQASQSLTTPSLSLSSAAFPIPQSSTCRAGSVDLCSAMPQNDSGHSLQCVGISCRQGLGCPRHPGLSSRANGGNAESPKANNPLCHSQSPRGGSSNEAEKLLNSRSPPRKDEDRTKTGNYKDCLPSARRSSGREGTLCCDSANEGDSDSDEGELVGAEPPVQPSAAKTETLSATSVVIDTAIPMMRRTIVLLRIATQSIAGMMISSSRHDASAAG